MLPSPPPPREMCGFWKWAIDPKRKKIPTPGRKFTAKSPPKPTPPLPHVKSRCKTSQNLPPGAHFKLFQKIMTNWSNGILHWQRTVQLLSMCLPSYLLSTAIKINILNLSIEEWGLVLWTVGQITYCINCKIDEFMVAASILNRTHFRKCIMATSHKWCHILLLCSLQKWASFKMEAVTVNWSIKRDIEL